MTFRISLGMIVRNEERTLRQCLESVAPFVDEIVIGLGGESTDDTEKIAREFTDKVFSIEWHEDFSEARNQVLDRVTGDYFLWLDGDDELRGGEHLPALIRMQPNVDSFFMGYDYGRDEDGHTICYLIRERLVRLQDELPDRGWRWVGKVHEVLIEQGFSAEKLLVDDMVVIHHKPPNKHEVNRNQKILYQQLEDSEPNPDPRILAYLATENASRGNFKEAILHGQRFIRLSGWDDEKYQMQHHIADWWRLLGDTQRSIQADFNAIQIKPDWPDAFFGLAETFNSIGDFRSCVEWTKAGATKPQPRTALIINPLEYNFYPVVLLAGAYAHLGDFEMSLANYEKAYEIKQEPLIREQIELLRNELHLHKVVDAFALIREQLGRNDEWLKVRKLYDVVPKAIEQHPFIQESWQRSMFQTAHVTEPSIMEEFYTGNPYWTPMSDEQILGKDWLNYPRMRLALDTARRFKAKTIVDWGCSDGFISLPLARETGAHVTGFDLDPRCVDLATLRAEKWGLDARFEVGNIDQIGGWEGEKADLAILFEVLEHTVNPDAVLEKIEKTARHIVLTTPFLSWEHGNIPAWDRLEPKGHLRIFDQFDLEGVLSARGRIHNLYREPWGNTGWLFADYTPHGEYDRTIIIGAMGAPEQWNPRSLRTSGLGGSETAVIRLAEELAVLSHKVVVYSTIDEPGYYNDVCYRPQEHYRPQIPADLYIAWRSPEAADWDINARTLALWLHDTDVGDRLTPERAAKFDYIVVLTEWAKKFLLEKYPFLEKSNIVIIGNGVDPERFTKKVKREPKRVIYSSSPDRGLDIILESIWPKVIEAVPEAELHIYYGWDNFDKFAPVFPFLKEFKDKVFELLKTSKNVVQHGRVNQTVLADAFQKSSIWLYPTYFTETYCITAVEAQLGGAIPITNRLAALSETVRSGVIIEGDVKDPTVQENYAKAVIHLLSMPMNERSAIHRRVRQGAPRFSWIDAALIWSSLVPTKENTTWQTPFTMSDGTIS